MKKRIILIFIGIIFIAALAFILNAKPSSNPFVPKPIIPNIIQRGYKIDFNVNDVNANLPNELALINIDSQTPLDKEEAQKIANNLGYQGDPKAVNDINEGTTYIWNSESGPLIAYSKSRRVEYSFATPTNTINKQISDEGIKNIAKDFLVKNFGLSNDELSFSFFTYINFSQSETHGERTSNKKDASVYQVNFTPNIGDTKLLSLDPDSSPIYVWITPDGTVAQAVVTKFKDIETSSTKFKLKSLSEIKNTINQSVIVSLDNGNLDPEEVSKSVDSVAINSLDIAYLIDRSKSSFLSPVYVLTGTAKIKGTLDNKNVNTTLYLPAIAN